MKCLNHWFPTVLYVVNLPHHNHFPCRRSPGKYIPLWWREGSGTLLIPGFRSNVNWPQNSKPDLHPCLTMGDGPSRIMDYVLLGSIFQAIRSSYNLGESCVCNLPSKWRNTDSCCYAWMLHSLVLSSLTNKKIQTKNLSYGNGLQCKHWLNGRDRLLSFVDCLIRSHLKVISDPGDCTWPSCDHFNWRKREVLFYLLGYILWFCFHCWEHTGWFYTTNVHVLVKDEQKSAVALALYILYE